MKIRASNLPCSHYWFQNKSAKMLTTRCMLSTWWSRCIWLRWNFPGFFVFWMHTVYTAVSRPYCRQVTWSMKMLTPCMSVQRLMVADEFPWRRDFHKAAIQLRQLAEPMQWLHKMRQVTKSVPPSHDRKNMFKNNQKAFNEEKTNKRV